MAKEKCKIRMQKTKIEENESEIREINCSMALSHAGCALAKPFTSFLVRERKSPRINDIVLFLLWNAFSLLLVCVLLLDVLHWGIWTNRTKTHKVLFWSQDLSFIINNWFKIIKRLNLFEKIIKIMFFHVWVFAENSTEIKTVILL